MPTAPRIETWTAPIVGENSIGIRLAWRSFQAVIRRSASSSTCASVARRLAASFSAASALVHIKINSANDGTKTAIAFCVQPITEPSSS